MGFEKRLHGYVFPTYLMIFILQGIPFICTIWLGFCSWYLPTQKTPIFVGFSNYLAILKDPSVLNSLQVMWKFLLVGVSVELLLALLIALYLQTKKSIVFKTMFILPMFTSPLAMTLIWRIMYNPSFGIINQMLSPLYRAMGIPPLAWASSASTALMSVIILNVWRWTPFTMLILLAGLQSIPIETYEAGAVDGVSAWQKFIFITLPQIRKQVVIALLFRSIDILKTFDEIYVLTGGGPARATEIPNILLYFKAFEGYQIGYSSAITTILFIVGIAMALLLVNPLKNKEIN